MHNRVGVIRSLGAISAFCGVLLSGTFAVADEIGPVENVRAKADFKVPDATLPPGSIRLTWNQSGNAQSYEIWGKVQDPAPITATNRWNLGRVPAAAGAAVAVGTDFPFYLNYPGYAYYSAFSDAMAQYALVGKTTSLFFDIQLNRTNGNAYSFYASYSEYLEYCHYGNYRIVAVFNTTPTGKDGGTHVRSLPSAEVHVPIIDSAFTGFAGAMGNSHKVRQVGNDIDQPGSVTYQQKANSVVIRWSSPTQTVTNYEIWRKRYKAWSVALSPGAAVGKFSATKAGSDGNFMDYDTDGVMGGVMGHFTPYWGYNAYNVFNIAGAGYTGTEDLNLPYQSGYMEFVHVATVPSTTNAYELTVSTSTGPAVSGLGGYHEYSTYSTYSAYLEYGVFKVVAVNRDTAARSPASAEAIAYSAGEEILSGSSSSGTCFLTNAQRNR